LKKKEGATKREEEKRRGGIALSPLLRRGRKEAFKKEGK